LTSIYRDSEVVGFPPACSADGDRTILFVDDVPMFRELGALFLGRSARVVTASSGDAALDIARRVHPDLILTDFHMPGMQGDELCRIVKADPELQPTPVIVMLGPQDLHERAQVVRAGADDLLVKPLNRVGLIEAVNRFSRWESVRGLPRIDCALPVEVGHDRQATWGTARNLSRGGLYVETVNPLALETEVGLRFALPQINSEFSPTAQVIWRIERDTPEFGMGMGLRFLEIDGTQERRIDDYIFHHRFSRDLPLGGPLP
jgi:uncharacterized protein (TIGR02266 family)